MDAANVTDTRESTTFACVTASPISVGPKAIKLLALGVARLFIQTADAKSHVIRCTGLGSWSCNGDGICIDSTRIRGKKYTYDTKKMTHRTPQALGFIKEQATNPQGNLALELDDQTHLIVDERISSRESRSRTRHISVIHGGGYNTTEL